MGDQQLFLHYFHIQDTVALRSGPHFCHFVQELTIAVQKPAICASCLNGNRKSRPPVFFQLLNTLPCIVIGRTVISERLLPVYAGTQLADADTIANLNRKLHQVLSQKFNDLQRGLGSREDTLKFVAQGHEKRRDQKG